MRTIGLFEAQQKAFRISRECLLLRAARDNPSGKAGGAHRSGPKGMSVKEVFADIEKIRRKERHTV
jgi:hypothetical protein